MKQNEAQSLKVGSRVQWKNTKDAAGQPLKAPRFFPGTVTKIHPHGITISYDDGQDASNAFEDLENLSTLNA